MRANIYVRVENEAAWESLKDKSGLVNDALDLLRLSRSKPVSAKLLKDSKEKAKLMREGIKKLDTPSELGECPRHHIDKSRCGCL